MAFSFRDLPFNDSELVPNIVRKAHPPFCAMRGLWLHIHIR